MLSVAAGGRPELVLAVIRVYPVREPEPGRCLRRADEHAAEGGRVGERHLLAELGLPGIPDGDVAEPRPLVVVHVGDETALLVVADRVLAEVYGELGLDGVAPGRRVAQQDGGAVGLPLAHDVRLLDGPVVGAAPLPPVRLADPGPRQ